VTAALELTGVTARLGGRITLEDVTLSVEPGEVLGLVGPNGAGKTTLIRAALGLTPLAAGHVALGGKSLASLNERERAALVGYLPQERRVAWNMPAWRVAALGAADRPPAEAHAAARACLAELEAGAIAERGVLDMSGGERARVLLARLLTVDAPLLVADEPAAGLDPDAQLLVLDLLREEAAKGRAVVLTLHDLTLAARACDRLVVLHEGRVVAEGKPKEALTAEILARVFKLSGELVETSAGLMVIAGRFSDGDRAT